jgi:hypothetical protein
MCFSHKHTTCTTHITTQKASPNNIPTTLDVSSYDSLKFQMIEFEFHTLHKTSILHKTINATINDKQGEGGQQWFKRSMDGDGQHWEPHGPISALVEHWIKLDGGGGGRVYVTSCNG